MGNFIPKPYSNVKLDAFCDVAIKAINCPHSKPDHLLDRFFGGVVVSIGALSVPWLDEGNNDVVVDIDVVDGYDDDED